MKLVELNYVEIGDRIRELRQMHNLSQTQLADQLGVTSAYMSRVEHGISRLTLEKVVQLSQILSISVDQLLFDEETAALKDIYLSINRCLSSVKYRELKMLNGLIQSFYKSFN